MVRGASAVLDVVSRGAAARRSGRQHRALASQEGRAEARPRGLLAGCAGAGAVVDVVRRAAAASLTRSEASAGTFTLEAHCEVHMRGTPRSIMLTWANTIASWWTSATVSAIQHRQRTMLSAMLKAAKSKRAKTNKRRRRR
jgi:hypothetical protein